MISTFCSFLLAACFSRPLDRVTTIDPLYVTSAFECFPAKLLYETPLEVDFYARPYRLIPGACSLPEVSKDGLSYSFKMKSPFVSSHDIARSISRILDPNAATPNFWLVKDIKSLETPDDKTIIIRLKNRCHFFPWLMALPQMGIQKSDGSGTGVFKLEKWRRNHEMVFVRRDANSLPNDPSRIDKIRYLVIDDPMTQWLMFLKGELNFIEDVSRDCIDAIHSDSTILERANASSYSVPLLQFCYIGINMTDPVIGKNAPLRRALNAAFDGETWKKFYNNTIVIADTVLPPNIAGRIDEPYEYSYDLEKARKLLEQAGYPNGIDPKTGRRIELTLTIGKANQAARERGELLQSFFEKIGVSLKLDFMTWDAFLTAVNEGRVQLFDIAWLADYPDAQNFMQLFYSKSMRPGPNRCAYSSADFDREYEAAIAASDEETRNRHWIECQRILRRDSPVIMQHYKKSFSVAKNEVKGLKAGDFLFGCERNLHIENQPIEKSLKNK